MKRKFCPEAEGAITAWHTLLGRELSLHRQQLNAGLLVSPALPSPFPSPLETPDTDNIGLAG